MSATALTPLNLSLPIGSLDAYIRQVNQLPFLSAEEEHDLACRLRDQQDLDAARQLVMSHLRFVVKITRGYAGYGLSQEDLIQEGNIGLMKAVKRFNPAVGVRLVSFAVHWIRAEIHEFIVRNWRIVKIATTKAQRKLFFNLRKANKRLGWFNNQEIAAVAEDLKVTEADVRQMEARLNQADEALEYVGEEESESFAPIHYLEDQRYNPGRLLEKQDWYDNQHQNLHLALTQLDVRSQEILKDRWLNEKKSTLHQLARKYKVSAERIRQLEKMAMEKLRAALS
jgi:RNA polymerase sigma-32 factor